MSGPDCKNRRGRMTESERFGARAGLASRLLRDQAQATSPALHDVPAAQRLMAAGLGESTRPHAAGFRPFVYCAERLLRAG